MFLPICAIIISLLPACHLIDSVDYRSRIDLTNNYIHRSPLNDDQLDLFADSFSSKGGLVFLEILMKYFKNYTTPQCQRDIEFTLDSYQNYTDGKTACKPTDCACSDKNKDYVTENVWIKKLMDSYGKQGSYVEQGNVYWLGGYSECLSITKSSPSDPTQQFQGRYCTVSNIAYNTLQSCDGNKTTTESKPTQIPIHYGVCIPRSCFKDDIGGLQMSADIIFNHKVNFTLTCHDTLHLTNDVPAIIMITVCSLIGLIMLIATGVDLMFYQHQVTTMNLVLDRKAAEAECYARQTLSMKMLLSFSVYSNTKKIFSIERTTGEFDCVHGIRFLSMTWVILGHTYFFSLAVVDNMLYFTNFLYNITEQTVLNATFSVDTFFVLSGLLVCYLWLKETAKQEGKNVKSQRHWILYYILRFIRIAPPYMLLMGLDITLFRYLTDGPFWSQTGVEKDYCRDTWWTSLLFINNLVDPQNMCFAWAWYLANDMQFHWIAPLVLIFLWRFPAVGISFSLILVVVSSIANGAISYVNNYPPNQVDIYRNFKQFNSTSNTSNAFDDVYIKPYTRAGPFFIGVILGYLLFRCRERKIKLTPVFNTLFWCVAAVLNLSVLYGLYNVASGGTMNKVVSALYSGVARSVWSIGVGWVVFACTTGNGGIVNKFLSWRYFTPLSRLTYCAYLIHPLVIMYAYYSRETALHFDSDYTMVYFFFAHVVIAYSLAFVASLAFESPVVSLVKILLTHKTSKSLRSNPSDVKSSGTYEEPEKVNDMNLKL